MVGSMDRWSGLRRAAVAGALVASVFGFGTTLAVAQQVQQPSKTPPKSATQKVWVDYSAWVKLCEKRDETTDKQVCLIKYEGLDPQTGDVEVAAAVRTAEGEDRQDLSITVPSTSYAGDPRRRSDQDRRG